MTPALRRPALAGAALLSATLATSALAATLSPASAADPSDSQLVSGNVFLSNGVVEFGSRADGSFGSDQSAPAGFHPHSDNGDILGFVSDRDKDGFGVGTDDGDFFTPGSPYEAWGIQVGGNPSRWNAAGSGAVPGAWAAPVVTGTSVSSTWSSTAPTDGVSVAQTVSIPSGQQYLDITITLTNDSGAPLTDVRYARGLDADNCRTRTEDVCTTDSDGDGVGDTLVAGSYETQNTVVSQLSAGDAASVVSATQTDGSYIDLRSAAAGAAVYMGTNDRFCTAPDIDSLASGTATEGGSPRCEVSGTKGTTKLADDTFFIEVDTPTLAAGASRSFLVRYVLSEEAAVDLGTPPPPAADPAPTTPTCAGKPATIVAVAGQVTTGTDGPDVIVGTAGDDTINAGAGDDLVCAGAGNDTVNGGDGADTLDGEAGDDLLKGGTGTDTISGGDGVDRVKGGRDADRGDGGAGDDKMSGGQGDDRLLGGAGDDLLKGKSGDDTLSGQAGADRLRGGRGDDHLRGGPGKDKVDDGVDEDTRD